MASDTRREDSEGAAVTGGVLLAVVAATMSSSGSEAGESSAVSWSFRPSVVVAGIE